MIAAGKTTQPFSHVVMQNRRNGESCNNTNKTQNIKAYIGKPKKENVRARAANARSKYRIP